MTEKKAQKQGKKVSEKKNVPVRKKNVAVGSEVKKAENAKEKKPVHEQVSKEAKVVEEPARPVSIGDVSKQLGSMQVVLYPLVTEKAVNMIESENKIVFVVDKDADKGSVRKAVEELYRVKVESVRVLNDRKGRKNAIVRLRKDFRADEIATRLGVI